MRNLQQISHKTYDVKGACVSCYRRGQPVTARIQDGYVLVEQHGSGTTLLASFDVPQLSPDEADHIVDLHHSEEDDSLCLIMYGGDIVTVQLSESTPKDAVEIIGTIDQAVLAAQWSPDEEIVAILTSESLNILTRQFESLAEVPIAEQDLNATSAVSVGWGRPETQFRGKNTPRDPTLPISIDEGILSKNDRRDARISWRGDAQYLSITTVQRDRRAIRVYSRDGALDSVSEAVNGHEGPLSWKPNGSLISSTQLLPDGTTKCIMFERNGLRHGDFDLRITEPVKDLYWNYDGTVLASRTNRHIDLWVVSNYHYSLKARIPIEDITELKWHPEEPLNLLVTSPDQLYDIKFRWRITSQEPLAPNDFGLVAMVDGVNLGLTPVRLNNIPPPMSLKTLQLEEIARDIAISDDSKFLLVLNSKNLQIYEWDLSLKPIPSPELRRTIELDLAPGVLPMQAVVKGHGDAYILLSSSQLLRITAGAVSETIFLDTSVYILQNLEDGALTQAADGSLTAHSLSNDKFKALPRFCHTIAARQIDKHLNVFGLSGTGSLFAGGIPIAQKVTSFLLVGPLLLYTTSSFLKFVHLHRELKDLEDDVNDERCRRIERGSLLICSCPSAQSITVQAPRGNLETIFPRILVLAAIRDAISAGRWADAWQRVKIHRIDPNIMCDHDSGLFLENLGSFIAGLKTSTELDIFLINLKAEDVSITMYANTSINLDTTEHSRPTIANKINEICRKILEHLQIHHSQSHLSSILTSYLSMSPPNYRDALERISTLSGDQLDSAITHICFLSDPQLLYNEALGLYDLPLALLLAQRSQKDPREYVPFLQSIQQMPAIRQRFSLDDHLQRHSKALESLLHLEQAWTEAIAYIQKYSLWQQSLQLVRHDHNRYVMLVELYAEYLFDNQQYADAGYAFELVKNYSRATTAFHEAVLWEETLHCVTLAGLEIDPIARRLIERLIDQSKYSDAATIYHQYLKDDESAIRLHCKAFEFNRAILLAKEDAHRLVRPRLVEAFVQTSELLSDMKLQLQEQLPRLREVREKRADNPDSYFDGMTEEDTPDNVSLAGSLATTSASGLTRYTSATALTSQSKRSGRSRRRLERQRAKGKKGTIWEEEYLVNSFRRLVERLQSTRVDTRSLIIGLVRCDLRENASEIQKSITALLEVIQTNLDEVFSGITTLPEELQRSMGSKPLIEAFENFGLC